MTDYKRRFEELTRAILANPHVCQALREEERAKALARDLGYGLRGAPQKVLHDIITSSYGALLVRATGLKPPIDNKTWVAEIKKGLTVKRFWEENEEVELQKEEK